MGLDKEDRFRHPGKGTAPFKQTYSWAYANKLHFKKIQVEKKYPNLRKDAEKAAVAFVSKFEEVMLKIWSSLIHAGKVSAKFAIDVKE